MDFQGTLFAPTDDETTETAYERTHLDRGAWVDIARGWLPDPDDVFAALVNDVPWHEERRQMYDRMVDVPRLLHTYLQGDPLPHPRLAEARGRLTAHYLPELGEPFVTAGCCYYRNGHDSVAWHGDKIGKGRTDDTMVAIVSVGDPRRLALRPHGGRGGKGMSIEMGHGDLVVMGGSCQRTWEHAIPKVSSAGPRISVQFRPRNVF
ncbi:Alkylated DNA repair dioxygenase AlkB [Nocardioides sp. YR527]|uniref:alpha-ketoglutarate-dependent dioxygenase AlkB n=1 Tax=Nocardioides sp. YR527 TaxID=1881028 RepID=UPI00088784ED|nr:alpha-ketoglutarate-dependent dioxygenase AlkB [Nocardioides sp. YR527]SDK37390.1 Alkylated DNA repair dioxygenase AlkB [Nocardioides sp. YR527]